MMDFKLKQTNIGKILMGCQGRKGLETIPGTDGELTEANTHKLQTLFVHEHWYKLDSDIKFNLQ